MQTVGYVVYGFIIFTLAINILMISLVIRHYKSMFAEYNIRFIVLLLICITTSIWYFVLGNVACTLNVYQGIVW